MTPTQKYYALTAKKVIACLEKRNMSGYYCETKEEAVYKVLELIPDGASVSWGGSMTLAEIDLFESLKKRNYTLLDRDAATTSEEATDICHKALSCDTYLMSSNAITLDGKLVNIDGNGNRIAALIYGPSQVLIVAGMNKITSDEETAMKRIRNYSSPINAIRLHKNTPCEKTGYCHDCMSEDCICCQVLVTRMSRHKDRIKIILVGEELGY
jgi:hypothetical protein